MIRRSRALVAAALAAALVATAACSNGSDSDDSNSSPGTGTAIEKVRYVTTFGKVGRDAFAWVGREKGFFKEAGIDIEITPGKATGENLKLLAADQVDISNLDIVGAWILAGQGTFKDFRTFAAIHQQSLVSIITLEGNGIETPKDLEGKTIAAAKNSVNQVLFPAYAQLAGFDESKVKFQDTDTTALTGLLVSGKVPAVSTFLLGQKAIEKAAGGKKVIVLPYSNYLTDLFGNGLVTSTKFAEAKPEVVKRFRDAAMKAVQYTIDHPEEAAKILHEAEPTADETAAIGEITAMTPYVTAGLQNQPVGYIDEAKVARSIAIMESSGLVPAGLKPSDVVDFSLTAKAS